MEQDQCLASAQTAVASVRAHLVGWTLGIRSGLPVGRRGRSACLCGLAWRWGTGQLAGLGRA